MLEQALIAELDPGSIIVVDNLPAHKASSIRQYLEAAGMACYFSRPIALTPSATPSKSILKKFNPGECAYIGHSGYAQI